MKLIKRHLYKPIHILCKIKKNNFILNFYNSLLTRFLTKMGDFEQNNYLKHVGPISISFELFSFDIIWYLSGSLQSHQFIIIDQQNIRRMNEWMTWLGTVEQQTDVYAYVVTGEQSCLVSSTCL